MVGVTLGDVSGIGPEITLKALKSLSSYRKNLLIIGNRRLLEKLQRKFVGQGFSLAKYQIIDAFDDFKYKYGEIQKQCGIASFLQLHLASQLLKVGKINGIVTAPVSKTALKMAGFPYVGQTEYFANEFGIEKYAMLGWSEQIKIALVTIHTPLKQVPKLITMKNVLDKIILLNNYLKTYEKIRKPKIGVFALNPHAFEFTCGAEEKILKAIKQARKQGISCDGPLPADSAISNLRIFQSSNLPIVYDGFVAQYHDQGMLPVKLVSQWKGACPAPFSKAKLSKYKLTHKTPAPFKNWCGVNTTLGLPFIRTSPLHGVAFDIAGQGIADPSSMISAIQLCQKLTRTKL